MKPALVSVIIPTYNRAGTIERTINSVLAQSWGSMEILVVDDGSTDHTADVLSGFGDRIRVIRQSNRGPSGARNAGIRAARGEVISFLDSDDEWLPDKTERQVKLLQATESLGVVCCVCNTRMEFANRTTTSFAVSLLQPSLREGIWTNPAEVLVTRFLLFNQVVAVRRQALEQAGYFREDLPFGLNDDYDLAVRLSLLGPWAFIADPLTVWHEHATNISRTHSHLDISIQTLNILQDLSRSPQFGPLFPKVLLRRRVRDLKRGIVALRLSNGRSLGPRLLGTVLHLLLRMRWKLYSRLPCTPRMITRAV
ncbi:MAG TPA: glycosyltransferase family A protein [Verrucomicrobiae bacterium]|nr:glycosyltransferase family A protein [Verrucomicrobiae bacterium]